MSIETATRKPHPGSAKANPDWMTARAASLLLGCPETRVGKLAAEGLITRRTLPNTIPRYLRTDVEALARRYTTPATRSAGHGMGEDATLRCGPNAETQAGKPGSCESDGPAVGSSTPALTTILRGRKQSLGQS
jgi:hypothetical protein